MTTVTFADIAAQRLARQYLLTPHTDPQAVIRSLGAVQSQDFAGAKWALGNRCTSETTDTTITELYNQGKILRTHILRPTWHFVLPEDIYWIQALTAPRVQAFCKYYYKQLALDEATLQQGVSLLKHSLQGGSHLTRSELRGIFQQAGHDVSALRLSFFILYAELQAVVCSGVMRGKQHTLALLEERVPPPRPRQEALAALTERFFTSHGPATIQDFAWWSSLTVADIKQGIQLAGLQPIDVEGVTFYAQSQSPVYFERPHLRLLPNYDEYVVGYRERRPFNSLRPDNQHQHVDLDHHFIVLDGHIIGGWKRPAATKRQPIHLSLFKPLPASAQQALHAEAAKLSSFLSRPVDVIAA